jgi:hypothetical protein
MHDKPMTDDQGVFGPWMEGGERLCPLCKQKKVRFREWESKCGGFVDLHFECLACGNIWWIDGCDA